MKKVIVHEASDGFQFATEDKALKHEEFLGKRAELLKLVRASELDPKCEFGNGGGFKQLSKEQVKEFTLELGKLIKTKRGKKEYELFKENPRGIIGRYLSDSSDSYLYELQGILNRIDDKNRLWGQPYFASHPDEGKQIAL